MMPEEEFPEHLRRRFAKNSNTQVVTVENSAYRIPACMWGYQERMHAISGSIS